VKLKKSEKRLVVILGIVSAVFLFDRFVLSSDEEESSTLKPGAKGINSLLSATALSKLRTTQAAVQLPTFRVEGKQFATWGRNPFSGPKSTSEVKRMATAARNRARQNPTLQGFFWKQGKTYVMVNDAVLTEGEEKDGLRIEKIRDKEVLCSQGGRTFTLYWRESQ